jgi:hypothetical protein
VGQPIQGLVIMLKGLVGVEAIPLSLLAEPLSS